MSYRYENRPVATPLRCVWASAGLVVIATFLYSASLQEMLQDQLLMSNMISAGLWQNVVTSLGGEVKPHPLDGSLSAVLPLWKLFTLNLGIGLLAWLGGAAWLSRKQDQTYRNALYQWGWRGWIWLLVPVLWNVLWFLLSLFPVIARWELFLEATRPYWWAVSCAGWSATFFTIAAAKDSGAPQPDLTETYRLPPSVWLAMALFVACLFTMNRQLYIGLQTPHGDSAMYEEHLWNLTHGKGFRSFLDYDTQKQPPQYRLFLGEHLQVIHVFLLPLYLMWPSHLALELCETLALASGAMAVYWMARRHALDEIRSLVVLCLSALFSTALFRYRHRFQNFSPDLFWCPAAVVCSGSMGTRTVENDVAAARIGTVCERRLRDGHRPAGFVDRSTHSSCI